MTGAHLRLAELARANTAPLSAGAEDFLRDMEQRTAEPSERQMEYLRKLAERVSFRDLAQALAARMGELASALGAGDPTHEGKDEWRFRTRGSLSVEIGGANRGSWYDHEAGTGGDALQLVAHLRRETVEQAAEWAQGWLGGSRASHGPLEPQEAAAASPKPPGTINAARRAWGEAVAPSGTPVEAYLGSRGLSLEPGLPLRFHPRCQRGSVRDGSAEFLRAMLALMTDPVTGEPCGVHRTFLAPNGLGKAGGQAKMMLGGAGVIRLSPDEDVTTRLGLAEGIETALSVMQGYGWRPVWAAASAGAVAEFPVLAGVESLSIFADADGPGVEAARACGSRWCEAGRDGRIVIPPAGDWNDAHRSAA